MTDKMADTGGGSGNETSESQAANKAQVIVDRMRRDAESLLALDEEAFVGLAHELSYRARDVENTFVGDKHPFAKSAGLLKNDPDWPKYKAIMAGFRGEDAPEPSFGS